MTVLQARGEGLSPINTECMTDSLVGFLEREGYTDIRVVVTDKTKRRKPDAPSSRRTSTVSTRRTVTRRPRV